MTVAKIEVYIGWLHANYYLVVGENENLVGGFFLVESGEQSFGCQ